MVYRFTEYTRGFESFLPPYRTDRNVVMERTGHA